LLQLGLRVVGAIAVISTLVSGQAYGASAIGQFSAKGSVQIDSAVVSNGGTLFDGNQIQTLNAASEIQLNAGGSYQIAPQSKARVEGGSLLLESGVGELRGTELRIQGSGVAVRANTRQDVARVSQNGAQTRVEGLGGSVGVWRKGVLLARVSTGSALEITEDATAPSSSAQISGVLEARNGKLFLRDEATQTVFEVRGEGLETLVGKKVKLAGDLDSAPAAGATHAIKVQRSMVVTKVAKGLKPKAVIAGVTVVSAAGVGLGLGLTQSEETSTVSR
jgi:hypothetical protein